MDRRADRRRTRLESAHLYLVCDRRDEGWLRDVLAAGVDVVQLRDKRASDEELLAAARTFRHCCDDAGALFVFNDRPDLAVAANADGVHLGQDDVAVDRARQVVGPERLVGLSTHGPEQLDAAAGMDYIAVGPVYATPTKPGRPAIGLEPVRYAAEHAGVPFFAIGGIDPDSVGEVVRAGARRVAVVRAIVDAEDPAGAARQLRAAVETRSEAGVGTA